jgi:hypothetical protein
MFLLFDGFQFGRLKILEFIEKNQTTHKEDRLKHGRGPHAKKLFEENPLKDELIRLGFYSCVSPDHRTVQPRRTYF